MAAGSLIVDGAITTNHMTAGSIQADRLVAGSITTALIAAGAITANEIQAGAVTAAKIVAGGIDATTLIASGTITGAQFNTGTSLPGTITVGVTGVSIGTIQSQASDPAARVNTQSTLIQPGKIQISGATALSSWINGTDTTKIEGGAIAANTISANKVTIGMRGITVDGVEFQHNNNAANKVSWTAGSIGYVDNAGVDRVNAVNANSTGTLWSIGTLYIYWTKPADGSHGTASTLATTTTFATANASTSWRPTAARSSTAPASRPARSPLPSSPPAL
jgi:hypothetical protein